MNVHVQGCNRRSSDSHNMASRSCSFRPFLVCISLCLAKILTISASSEFLTPRFRPPSVPLVVIDPYISVWSDNDHLYDAVPKHWSGPNVTMVGMIDIDGTSYRFMSNNQPGLPSSFMEQVDLKVYPTQTKYSFQQDGIQLDLTFSTPAYAVPGQLPYLPLTYLTYDVASIDGQNHKVHLYYDNTAEAAVADVDTMVQWSRVKMNGKVAMRIGSEKQHALEEGSKKINWGFWYVVVPYEDGLYTSMSSMDAARSAFNNAMNESKLPADDMNQPRACSDNWPVLAVMWDLDVVQANQVVSRHLTIVYDQMQSINYFGSSFIPYWKHVYDDSVENLVTKNMYGEVKEMCDMLDKNVTSQLFKVGGANYTTIASLAWRQAVGGTITVWNHVTQEVWMFMKEISSDGDVSTVDVIFPASPLFLWWDYKSIQLMLKPIMEYAMNNTYLYGLGVDYNLPWAPHHLGHWPVCNLEPEDQEQMPMEESGNMLLMIAASVLRDPKHDVSWLGPYWDMLITWGDFIMASLPDPGDQLCTDDFEGKSPHNVNLAAKGIVGLGALSYLLQLGQPTSRALVIKYNKSNTGFLEFWQKNASDGNSTARIGVKHYRLEFNESNTWSLKYNILYQEILKLDLFPDDVIEAELAYYMNHRNTYGIPLDSRANFTKADWQMWIAALGNDDQFSQITDMVYKFAHESEDRFPFCDWYTTDKAKMLGNFYARPVMGGVYAKMLVP